MAVDEAGMMLGAFRYDVCKNVMNALGFTFKALEESESEISTGAAIGCHYVEQTDGKVMVSMGTKADGGGCCQASFSNVASRGATQAQCKRGMFWNPFATYVAARKACVMKSIAANAASTAKRTRVCSCFPTQKAGAA